MGGNVQLNGFSATRINLGQIERKVIRKRICDILSDIDNSFFKRYGTVLWHAKVIHSKQLFSGSSKFLFDDSISEYQLLKYKPTFGDIDVQIDINKQRMFEHIISNYDGSIGYKKSVDQIITLFYIAELDANIQIDFEFVDFDNGAPSDWASFSRSSCWIDIQNGIKGVFHKYLLRAMTTKSLSTFIVRTARTEKVVTATELAFSVTSGLRQKYVPVIDQTGKQEIKDGLKVFNPISTIDSTYTINVSQIFEIVFGFAPNADQLKQFESFVGCCDLISNYFTVEDRRKVVDGFIRTLWGKQAQKLYRDDIILDKQDKDKAYNWLISAIDFTTPLLEEVKDEYYKEY